MDRAAVDRSDPWGLAAESQRDRAAGSKTRAPRRRLRRPAFALLAGLCSIVLGTVVLPTSGSSAALTPHSGPKQVSKGPSVLYGNLTVVAASTAGVLLEPFSRMADGGVSYSPSSYAVLPFGTHSPYNLKPKMESSSAYIIRAGISGPLVVLLEQDDLGTEAAWWYSITSKKSGLVVLKGADELEAVVPGGVLVVEPGSSSDSLVEIALPSKKSTRMLRYTSSQFEYVEVTPGPLGFVVVGSNSLGETKVGYVAYAKPGHLVGLYTGKSESVTCESVTTTAAGCILYKTTTEYVGRFQFTGGVYSFTRKVAVGYPFPSVVVTPNVTAWYTCTNTGCPLHRVPLIGKRLPTYPLPIVGNIVSVGDEYYYSPTNGTTPAGGLYSLADTSKVPVHLATGFLVPYQAAAISVGSNSVAWIDDAASGLGVWTSSLSGSGALGKPTLLGGDGFLDSNSTPYSLNISDPASAIATIAYAKQPSASPLDIVVYINGKAKVLADSGDYLAPGGDPLTVSGNYVLWQTVTGYDLGDLKTFKVIELPMTGVATYALGGSTLAYMKTDGSIWYETTSQTDAKELIPPLPTGQDFYYVDNLSVASSGTELGWAYGWLSTGASGQVTQYMSTAAGAKPVNIPARTGLVSKVVVSPSIVAATYAQQNGTNQLWAASIKTSKWKEYAPAVYDVSVGGLFAAWLGPTNLPFIEKI